jgi:hypothetical protein
VGIELKSLGSRITAGPPGLSLPLSTI